MRVFHSLLLVCSTAFAYDAVFFSNDQKISKEYPSVDNLLSTASKDAPVVFITNPDFTLGQFSKQSSAYSAQKSQSGLVNIIKSSKHSAARYIEKPVDVPEAVVISSASEYKPDSSVYVISGEEWTTMETAAVELYSKFAPKATFVITSSEAVSSEKTRVKRVSTDEFPNDDAPTGNGKVFDMPMNIPPYGRDESVQPLSKDLGNCLLYLEGVNVVVQSKTSNGKGNSFINIPVRANDSQWMYDDGDVSCTNGTVGNYVFHVKIKTKTSITGKNFQQESASIDAGTVIGFTLKIVGDAAGYWRLKEIVADGFTVKGSSFNSAKIIDGSNSSGVNNMGVNSIQYWAYGCGDSQAAFFKTDNDKVFVGISLFNTEIQPFGVYRPKGIGFDGKPSLIFFTRNVDDCTGTFSTGSWMGIISILVLLTGFIFGYLMLNSVETMDRFDDPKQKQIIINVRE